MSGEKLQAALDWAARGFRVFPLQEMGKLPISKAWFETATDDPATITAMWTDPVTGWSKNYNIGVSTDDLIVVDIDVKNDKPGLESFAALGIDGDTLTVRTPSGGKHVYYRNPGDPRANSAGRIGLGLDVRGWHGFVVGPGSETDAGAYHVTRDADAIVVPTLLVDRLDRPKTSNGAADHGELDRPHHVMRGIAYLENEAQLAIEGAGGDATTFRVAANLKDYGVSEDVAFQLMCERWNTRCAPPWDVEELQIKVANAYAYGHTTPGASTPEAFLAGIDVETPAPAKKPSRAWVHHGDVHATENWLYYETLPTVGVALLVGPSQGGKTFVALELARSLYAGRPFFGVCPDDLGCSLFLFGGTEGSGLGRRLDALGEDAPIGIAATRIGVLNSASALGSLADDIAEKMQEMELMYGHPVRMVVLETLSASGLLKDENDNAEMAMAVSQLGQLAVKLGVLLLVTHHPTKSGNGERGAGALRGNVDYVLEIIRDERAKIRTLELTKARDAEQRLIGRFTLVQVELGRDAKDRPITSVVVSQADPTEQPAVKIPPGWDVFNQSIDWASVDSAVEIEGRWGVDIETVKAFYKDANASKDRSNVLRAWKTLVGWAQQMGFVEVTPVGAKVFIFRTGEPT